MGRGWYRRRHVDRDVCGHPGAKPRRPIHVAYLARPLSRSPEAAALRGQAIGDGAVFQERYFRPPELIPGGSGKYGR